MQRALFITQKGAGRPVRLLRSQITQKVIYDKKPSHGGVRGLCGWSEVGVCAFDTDDRCCLNYIRQLHPIQHYISVLGGVVDLVLNLRFCPWNGRGALLYFFID